MVLVDRSLLFLAVLSLHGAGQVTAEPLWGRYNRRVLASNQTISTTSPSSPTTIAASVVSTASDGTVEAFGFVPTVSSVVGGSSSSAASVVTSSVSTASLVSSGQEHEAHGLETITTLPRTATVPWGSSPTTSAPSDDASPVSISGSDASAPVSSGTVFKNDTVANYQDGTTSLLYSATTSIESDPGAQLDSSVGPSPSLTLVTYSVDPGSSVSLQTPPAEGPTDGCSATTNFNTVTVWSTIYTTTITWTGDPTDYTPPYPESTQLSFCSQTTARLSVSVCNDGSCSLYTYPAATATATSDDGHRKITSTATAGTTILGGSAMPTITFWTTDKNPAVVYSSEAPPDYGSDGTTAVQNHNPPDGDDSSETPQYEKYTTEGQAVPTTAPEADKQTPSSASAVTVVVQTTQVIINGQTFTDNAQSKSSTVVVGADTFTINPSQVIGAGATVTRPAAGGVFIPAATTTTVGGLRLVYGSSAATIDGTVLAIGSTPSSVVVQGQTITVGPGGIAFPSQTIPIIKGVGVSESAVLGGQLITAIGNSVAVIDGTTFTYGPGLGAITKVVDGDPVVVGPSGVVVHGMTLGGAAAAAPTATTYEIAGGATITEVGGSAVVVDGTTYLIGAGATSALTTVVDGQTLTIGPSGVAVSSYTFAQPYATSTVIEPGATSAVAAATDAAENAGRAPLRPSWDLGATGMCIAIGVGFLVGLLY